MPKVAEVGDVVVLSGTDQHILMTVNDLMGTVANCVWFDADGVLRHADISRVCLRVIERS